MCGRLLLARRLLVHFGSHAGGTIASGRQRYQPTGTGSMNPIQPNLSRRGLVRLGAAATVAAMGGLGPPAIAQSAGTIKIGILHSLSGTMAISETTLKDVMLMLIDKQNKAG